MSKPVDRDKIIKQLRQHMSEDDLNHSIEVEKVALGIAKHYWFDETSTSIAALLHNCGKSFPEEDFSSLASDLGIKPDDFTHDPVCEHALLSEKVAERYFEIKNRDVLNSIKYHVLGRQKMSDLEKIIFISCFIVEDRSHLGNKVKRKIEDDFDEAFELAFLRKNKAETADPAPEKNRFNYKKISIFAFAALIAILSVFIFIVFKNISSQTGTKIRPKKTFSQNRLSNAVLLLNNGGAGAYTLLLVENGGLKKGLLLKIPNNLMINVPGFGADSLSNLASKVAPSLLTLSISNALGIKIQFFAKGRLKSETADRKQISNFLKSGNETNLFLKNRNNISNKLTSPGFKLIKFDTPVNTINAGAQSFSYIKQKETGRFFGGLTISKSLLLKNRFSVVILNGTGKPGIGNEISVLMMKNDFKVLHLGNAKTKSGTDDFSKLTTEIIFKDKKSEKQAQRISGLLGKGKITGDENSGFLADITIVIGKDML
jgi:predicted HD superfamily hydrolase involved in NAD metabolism